MKYQCKIKELLTPEEIKGVRDLRLMRVSHMSHYLGVCTATIRRWIKQQILPCKKRGWFYVIRANDFLETIVPSLRKNNDQ